MKKPSSKRPTAGPVRPSKPTADSLDLARKDSLVKRLNERVASIVRHAGVNNDEIARWQAKLTRGTRYITKTKVYDPSKMKTSKNRGHGEKATYELLSRSKKDLAKMSWEDLQRLDEQTKGWGAVKKEAKKVLQDQARAMQEVNPFLPATELPPLNISITDEQVVDYLQQKEAVRQFIEGHSEAFYALIESTGWDDIRDHTTEEIYNAIQGLDPEKYEFSNPLSTVGADYIARREAVRERRRLLGV